MASAELFDCVVMTCLQTGSCYSVRRLLSGFPKKLLTGRISKRMMNKQEILMKKLKGTVLFKEFL